VFKKAQEEDDVTLNIIQECINGQPNPDYSMKNAMGKKTILLHYHDRIMVPEPLREPVIEWYHINLGHLGSEKLYQTLK